MASYALLVLAFVWPLPLNLGSHLTGDPAGDAGAYAWNTYVFWTNLTEGTPLFATDRILTAADQVSLALHNNSLLLSVLAAPLIPAFGVIAAFNTALVTALVLNPLSMYVLARFETSRRGPSWIAGLLFGFSPFIGARVEGHMSLATAFVLPVALLALRRAWIARTTGSWAVAGVAVAACALADPYYLVFAALAAAFCWVAKNARFERMRMANQRSILTFAALFATPALAATIWILLTGGGRIDLGDITIGIRGRHTPMLILTLASLVAAWASSPFRVRFERGTGASARRLAIAMGASALALSPWLSVSAEEVLARRGSEATHWRSSPPGVDVASFILPNPTHGWVRAWVEPWMTRERGDAFVEGVSSLTVAGLAASLGLAWLGGTAPGFWVAFTAFFALLACGPFLTVGGHATYIPGPWSVLRFLPGLGMVRSPSRFSVLVMIGFALCVAHLLATARLGKSRRLVTTAIACIFCLETFGGARTLYAAALPERYRVVAEDQCDVAVLRLPTGIKDGTRQRGRFSTETQFRQVFHGKRLLGGYLSRLSDETVEAYESHPTVRALMDLSEGKKVEGAERQAAVLAAESLSREIGIGFVALSKSEASQDLRDFANEAFRPRVVHKVFPFVVGIPFGFESCADGRCGHRKGCPHRPADDAQLP